MSQRQPASKETVEHFIELIPHLVRATVRSAIEVKPELNFDEPRTRRDWNAEKD